MSVPLLHGRSIRLACLLAAMLVAAIVVLAAGPARAAHQPPPMRIVRPYHTNVAGTIFFSVRGIEAGAQQIVFLIDGRKMWAGSRLSPRLRRPMTIDTTKLRNGRHVLALKVRYPSGRTAVARKTIVVRNRHAGGGVSAHQASAGSSTANGSSTSETNTVGASAGASAGGTSAGGTSAGGTGGSEVNSGGASAGGTSAGGSAGGAGNPPPGGGQGTSVTYFNRETYQYQTNLSPAAEANRYQFIVLSGNEYAEIPLLKASNPNLKFLLYQAIWMTNINDVSWMQTVTGCTPYADDMANHPSWFLHDQNGNLITETGHPDVYTLDVGNAAYQQECATNAGALARQYGFDGVFFDVVDGRLSDDTATNSIPQYPTQTSWDNAMGSALAYLAPALRAQGLLVFGNVANTISAATWEQWVGHLDGVEEESWTDAGSGLAQQLPFWSAKFTELNWAAANGKYEFVHSYNTTEAANTFGLAAMLLGATGRASYSATNGATTDEYWFPEYDTAKALGAPTGPYTVLANGVYERAFAHGIVLANPTGNSIPRFSLGGGTYTGSGLTGVQSVALGPTSGLILLRTG